MQTLPSADTLVVPSVENELAWLGRLSSLDYHEERGTLLGLLASGAGVVEFGTAGKHLRTYGGTLGEGPGEVQRITAYAATPSRVALLDSGNGKVLVHDRKAELLAEFSLQRRYLAIAMREDDGYLLMPGKESNAFDVYAADGGFLRSIGDASSFPSPTTATAAAEMGAPICQGCELRALGDSLLVVASPESSAMSVYDMEGHLVSKFNFAREGSVISRWMEADQPYTEQAQSDAGPNTTVFKTYLVGYSELSQSRLAVSVVPDVETFQDRGYELWIVDLSTGSYERFRYAEPRVGYLATIAENDIIAYNAEDGGVYRVNAPELQEVEAGPSG